METLVLIPGLGSDAAVWGRTIAAIGGELDCRVGDTLSDTTLAGMAHRILDEAPQRFSLAGVSMGGMVALEMMRIDPGRITRLALVDTNARADTVAKRMSRHLANTVVRLSGDFEKLARSSVASLVHPSTSEDIRSELLEMSVRVGAVAFRRQNRAIAERGDLRSILPGIAAQTAVVCGHEDRLTPIELSEEIHRLVLGSTLHVLPDCGHLPPIERPHELAALLKTLILAPPARLRQAPS